MDKVELSLALLLCRMVLRKGSGELLHTCPALPGQYDVLRYVMNRTGLCKIKEGGIQGITYHMPISRTACSKEQGEWYGRI
jgi:hypothetical protein